MTDGYSRALPLHPAKGAALGSRLRVQGTLKNPALCAHFMGTGGGVLCLLEICAMMETEEELS